MNAKDAMEKSFKLLAHSENKRNLLTVFLEGPHGVGKTHMVREFANEIGEFFTANLSAMEPVEFTGRPTERDGIDVYTKPHFLNMKRGVLFFDEANRVYDPSMHSALLSLLLDREINGHKLSPEVMVVLAGNPVGEAYNTKEMDEAMKDRLMIIQVPRSFKSFKEHVLIKYDTPLASFIALNEGMFNEQSLRRMEQALQWEAVNGVEGLEAVMNPVLASEYKRALDGERETLDEAFLSANKKRSSFLQCRLANELVGRMVSLDFPADRTKALLSTFSAESLVSFFVRIKHAMINLPNYYEVAEAIKATGALNDLKGEINVFKS
jgi:hypothetical protein